MNINMELVKMLQTRQPPTLAVWVASLCEIMLSMMSPTNKILSPTVFGQKQDSQIDKLIFLIRSPESRIQKGFLISDRAQC